MFCILLAGYRYGLAAEVFQGDYKIDILKRINLVVRNEPISLRLDLTVGEVQGYNAWINNLDFRMLIASLDMYWVKFPDTPGSQLRVCTLNSRYKDCSSISELRHLSQMSSLTIGKALEYIFFTRVKDEVVVIGRPGEEFDKEDSYFPYMRELRISKKSPYSSSANVHLHNWVSIFSALLGSERSYHARIVSEDGILSALNLAIFSAYAFKRYTAGHFVFGGEDIAREAKARAHAYEGIDKKDVPQFADYSPMGVFTTIEDNGAVVPQRMITFFAQAISKYPPARPGTIGAYLQKALPQ